MDNLGLGSLLCITELLFEIASYLDPKQVIHLREINSTLANYPLLNGFCRKATKSHKKYAKIVDDQGYYRPSIWESTMAYYFSHFPKRFNVVNRLIYKTAPKSFDFNPERGTIICVDWFEIDRIKEFLNMHTDMNNRFIALRTLIFSWVKQNLITRHNETYGEEETTYLQRLDRRAEYDDLEITCPRIVTNHHLYLKDALEHEIEYFDHDERYLKKVCGLCADLSNPINDLNAVITHVVYKKYGNLAKWQLTLSCHKWGMSGLSTHNIIKFFYPTEELDAFGASDRNYLHTLFKKESRVMVTQNEIDEFYSLEKGNISPGLEEWARPIKYDGYAWVVHNPYDP